MDSRVYGVCRVSRASRASRVYIGFIMFNGVSRVYSD